MTESLKMPQSEHLKSNREIRQLFKTGKTEKYTKKSIIFKSNDLNYSRIACVIGKKVGNAPERNAFKRVHREAFRLTRTSFKKPVDVIIRFFPGYEKESTVSIQQQLKQLLC